MSTSSPRSSFALEIPTSSIALQAEHELGLLLPCNVIVHEHAGASVISVVDPAHMLAVVGDIPALQAAAIEAGERLRRVVAALGGSHDAPIS